MERRWTFCIRSRSSEDGNARWLIERRPSRGRWAGMWQFVTIQAGAETVPKLDDVGTRLPLRVTDVAPLGKVTHSLTHRRYEFDAFTCSAPDDAAALPHDPPRQWTTLANLDAYALPRPHLKIARMLAENG